MSQSMTLTFEDSDIPTSLNSFDPDCNGPLTTLQFSLPTGNPWEVTGVDIEYSMTAQGGGWKSHQRSQIFCQNSNMAESNVYEGTGNSGGIQPYSRNGVTIANGIYPANTTLIFEMRAWRTQQGSDCNVTYNKVNNFTWIMTIYYQAIADEGRIGIGTTTPDSSAILELNSLQKGFLPPCMSSIFMDAIDAPAEGLLIYCTDCTPEGIYTYNGSAWQHAAGTELKDADGDTYITVEQTPDEDKIRMGTVGLDRFTIAPDGKIGIGTNTPDYTLDILGQGNRSINIIDTSGVASEKHGVYIEMSGSSSGNQFGLYNLLNSSNDSSHIGITNQLTGSGGGNHIGMQNKFTGNGSGEQIGTRTSISNNGDGFHAGAFHSVDGDGNGPHFGLLNTVYGWGEGEKFGTSNYVSANSGSANNYGVYNQVTGAALGDNYGLINEMDRSGNGKQFGISNLIFSQADNVHDHEGVRNLLTAEGSGDHYGIRNIMEGDGAGKQYGAHNIISNTGGNTHEGIHNELSGNGVGPRYGVRNILSGIGGGTWRGVENNLTSSTPNDIICVSNYSSGSGDVTGIENVVESHGTQAAVGTTNEIELNNGGECFGTRNIINDLFGSPLICGEDTEILTALADVVYGSRIILEGSGNTSYGIYAQPLSTGTKYAGYFNGDVTVTGTFNNPSDRKFKTNITPISTSSSLSKLNALQIYQYEYDRQQFPYMSFPEQLQSGVIAQDMQEVFPELVKKNIHPAHTSKHMTDSRESNAALEYLGVDYLGLIPHLISAVQELQKNIEMLKEQNLQQQAIIEELRKR